MQSKLIKHENCIYRILDTKDDFVFVIDCIKCTMPRWISETELKNSTECTEQELLEVTNMNLPDIETLDMNSQKHMNECFTIISELLPYVSD